MKKCIACIMAHADDLEVCCGGTFAKYTGMGYKGIYGLLSLCNSGWNKLKDQGSYHFSEEIIPMRWKEAKESADFFGAEFFSMKLRESIFTDSKGKVIPLDYCNGNCQGEKAPEGDLPLASAAGCGMDGRITDTIAEVLIKNEPEIVIGQDICNGNSDHLAAALLVYKAWEKASQKADIGPYYVPVSRGVSILNNFAPHWICDISGYEETAEKAVSIHVSQGGHGFIPDMRKKWEKWGKEIHSDSAEAFFKLLPANIT
jgi:LmbE family N-acetylglucosaminyl deacetylase